MIPRDSLCRYCVLDFGRRGFCVRSVWMARSDCCQVRSGCVVVKLSDVLIGSFGAGVFLTFIGLSFGAIFSSFGGR